MAHPRQGDSRDGRARLQEWRRPPIDDGDGQNVHQESWATDDQIFQLIMCLSTTSQPLQPIKLRRS